MIAGIRLLLLLGVLVHFAAGKMEGQMQDEAARAGSLLEAKHVLAVAGATFTYDEMISGSISGFMLDSASVFNARKSLQSRPTPFSSLRFKLFASTTLFASETPDMSFVSFSVAGEGRMDRETRIWDATARALLRLEQRVLLWQKPELGALLFAGFADAGHGWTNSMAATAINRTRINSGIGLLLAPASHPTRALRIDFAIPLGPGADSSWELRIGLSRRSSAAPAPR